MITRVKDGALVLGRCKVAATFKEDAIYQWVKATDCNSGHSVVLQILRSDLSKDVADALHRYFDVLQGTRGKGLRVPTQVLSGADYLLVLVYPDLAGEPLGQALSRAPDRAMEWWTQASERLHAVHNNNLVHGRVTLDSFIVLDEEVSLANFGYAPLLESGYRDVLEECDDFLAPEVLDRNSVTRAADIYAFAKTVARWEPRLKTTPWCRQATDLDPDKRFRRIRDAFAGLKETLSTLPPEGGKVKGSSLRPKYFLDTRGGPPEGGSVMGGGGYTDGESVMVKAIPEEGWQFDYWSGDLSGSANPATLIMDANKTAIAHFKRAEAAPLVLRVSADPAQGGEVTGSGTYRQGQTVAVEARPRGGWKFDCWSGSLSGSTNPATLVMDTTKTAVAHFVRELCPKDLPNTPELDINREIDQWLQNYYSRTKYVKKSDFIAIKSTMQRQFPQLEESEIIVHINARIGVLRWVNELEKISQLCREIEENVSKGKIKLRDLERIVKSTVIDKTVAKYEAEKYINRHNIRVVKWW